LSKTKADETIEIVLNFPVMDMNRNVLGESLIRIHHKKNNTFGVIHGKQ
jgi:hypothetical protein